MRHWSIRSRSLLLFWKLCQQCKLSLWINRFLRKHKSRFAFQGCLRGCYQDAVAEQCGCMDPRYAKSPEATNCALNKCKFPFPCPPIQSTLFQGIVSTMWPKSRVTPPIGRTASAPRHAEKVNTNLVTVWIHLCLRQSSVRTSKIPRHGRNASRITKIWHWLRFTFHLWLIKFLPKLQKWV